MQDLTEHSDFIKKVREYALANYENGGDFIIECLSDSESVEKFSSIEDAKEYTKLHNDRRKEVESTIW